ncbi:hypothetical protein V1477_010332 [Vespula maculifrons]|uniref:Uncharacterized protein n=1 Tax=Vespula maculifrons TaxID=7453 RepID=A0ABD2C892_VESMC
MVQSCYEFRRVPSAIFIVHILHKIKLWSGDTELRETTIKSSVRPILTVNGSALLRISTSTDRNFHSTHSPQSGDTELREKTNSSVRLILTLTSSFLLRISTSTHRNFHSTHSPQSGDTELRETTIKSSVRPILTVNGSALIKLWSGDTGLRETTTNSSVRPTLTINGSVLLRISTSTHRNFHSTHSPQVLTKNQCKIKLWSGDTGLRETTTNSSVRPTLTINGSVLLRISTSTHRNFHSTHSPQSGDTELREKTNSSVRLILTLTSSFLLRILTSTHRNFHCTHSPQSGDTELRETTIKSSVRPLLTVNGSALLRILTSTDRNFHKLNCGVGILDFVRRQQTRAIKLWRWGYFSTRDASKMDFNSCWFILALNFDEYTSQFSQDAFFGSNREESIIKLWSGDTELRETTIKSGVRPILTVNDINCEVGILGFQRRQQSRVFDRLLQLLVQLCFGLRRENLKIFVEDIRASINEELIQIYNRLFDFTLKCEVGILGFERRQQRWVFDWPIQFRVQLCFELRRENLEIFAGCHSNFDFVLSRDFDNLSPRMDLEIFALSWDSKNLSPRVDLEIFALSWDSKNMSPQVDLEIFALSWDSDNLSPRVDLEIFAPS